MFTTAKVTHNSPEILFMLPVMIFHCFFTKAFRTKHAFTSLFFCKLWQHGKINVIPNNCERYILFHVGRLMFLDSMQFLSHGLDKPAEQLSSDQFKHLKAAYPEHWNFLSKKGIYCYDYMNSMERFDYRPRNTFLTSCMVSMYRRSSISMLEM